MRLATSVIGTMNSSEDLSAQILNNPGPKEKLLGELVPMIYDEMKKTA
jgi:type I restriction enzyme R subunit